MVILTVIGVHYGVQAAMLRDAPPSAVAAAPAQGETQSVPLAPELLQPTPPERTQLDPDMNNLRVELELAQTVAADRERRLQDAIQRLSDREVHLAKLEGRYPRSRVAKPGMAAITAIDIDAVYVQVGNDEPKPYHIGQEIPSAGRLLAIYFPTGEAIAEQTVLRVTRPTSKHRAL